MKSRKRHPEPKLLIAAAKKRPAIRAQKPSKKVRLSSPIFNGPLAGKHSDYIRPFDPVWPMEDETTEDATSKKKTSSRPASKHTKERQRSTPIFNTGLAGSVVRYERPFDPVRPLEPGDEGIILLDTHDWVWAVELDPLLDPAHLKIIEEHPNQVFISAVSLWEVSMLVSKGRLKPKFPLRHWFEFATATVGIPILPLTPEIARDAYDLPGTFHADPADRMIVATARVHDCLLLTEDTKIRKYRHVRTG